MFVQISLFVEGVEAAAHGKAVRLKAFRFGKSFGGRADGGDA